MIITTSEAIEGRKIVKTLGLVKGSTVRAKWIGKDVVAVLRNIVGGELKEYVEMLQQAREEAIDRMVEEAEDLGANAIVCVRFATAQTMKSAAEILAYGTAVKVE
jgi:uncharacterized protein YbjQ (UPF0145 family)